MNPREWISVEAARMQGAGLKEYSLYFEVPQRRSRGRIGRKAPRGFMRCALAEGGVPDGFAGGEGRRVPLLLV